MGRLVILRLDGDFETQGFRVTLEIRKEGDYRPDIEISGYLPPAPKMPAYIYQWQQNYRCIAAPYRIKPGKISYDGSVNPGIRECQESAKELRDRLSEWLKSESFRDIDARLREELKRDEAIRVLIRSNDAHLQKLPWHLWDFIERYSQAEVALSAAQFERHQKLPPVRQKLKVRILAILGHSADIDITKDKELLENLPNVEIIFLDEPKRQAIDDRLWDQPWDIIFFAGHSETEGETGRIYINPTDSLTIDELWYGLNQAIKRGLRLAIFNSCDGLGLARQLADLDLYIPQMIVMRELVPDRVAQEFLKHFLTAFAGGESFYLAVRKARERLQGLESEFPCATWLPAIFQNPVEMPPTWQELLEVPEFEKPKYRALSWQRGFQRVLLASVICATIVMGARYLGVLQAWELQAYDRLMQMRSPEQLDSRLLVVEIEKADTNQYGYPIEDAKVVELIKKIEQYEPRAIGLDMHRYQLRGQGRQELIDLFRKNPKLFTVCAFNSSDINYAPPSEFSEMQIRNQVGFSELLVDDFSESSSGILRRDLVVERPPESKGTTQQGLTIRRQLLSYEPKLSSSLSACTTPFSFSFHLAFRFLSQDSVKPMEPTKDGEWQFGKVILRRLVTRIGGYQNLDGTSNQILINYRSNQPAQAVTFTQVLSGQVGRNLVKDRVVLIGDTASVARDIFDTPLGQMPGVWIHAHMVSQILSAVRENRPLLWVLPQWGIIQWGDALWVWLWSLTGGLLAWRWRRSLLLLGLASGANIWLLDKICLLILARGGWMPFIPSVLSLIATGISLIVYTSFQSRRKL